MRVYERIGSSLMVNECIWEKMNVYEPYEGIWKYMTVYECKW